MVNKMKNEKNRNDYIVRSVNKVIAEWPHMHYIKISEAKEVIFRGVWPPIYKMDNSISLLKACMILSLSNNMIEKISNLQGLKNLKVLSLAQNNIKSLNGLESVGKTLEVLIIARNFIKETTQILDLHELKELDISYNDINDLREFNKLKLCKHLKDLSFKENPLARKFPADIWREEALKVLTGLESLDYKKVEENERYPEVTMSKIFNLKRNVNVMIHDQMYEEYNTILQDPINEMKGSEYQAHA